MDVKTLPQPCLHVPTSHSHPKRCLNHPLTSFLYVFNDFQTILRRSGVQNERECERVVLRDHHGSPSLSHNVWSYMAPSTGRVFGLEGERKREFISVRALHFPSTTRASWNGTHLDAQVLLVHPSISFNKLERTKGKPFVPYRFHRSPPGFGTHPAVCCFLA